MKWLDFLFSFIHQVNSRYRFHGVSSTESNLLDRRRKHLDQLWLPMNMRRIEPLSKTYDNVTDIDRKE